jgi:HEPN domain-containing protein
MNGAESNYQAWLSKADNDLLTVRTLLNAPQVPWDVVCFHAQQSTEKLLKAFLVHHGRVPPRVHDLVALLSLCNNIDPTLHTLVEDCGALTRYAVAARYPVDQGEPTGEDARTIIAAADRVREAVLARLPATDPKPPA